MSQREDQSSSDEASSTIPPTFRPTLSSPALRYTYSELENKSRRRASVDSVDYGYERAEPEVHRYNSRLDLASQLQQQEQQKTKQNQSLNSGNQKKNKRRLCCQNCVSNITEWFDYTLYELKKEETAAKIFYSKTWTGIILAVIILVIFLDPYILVLVVPKGFLWIDDFIAVIATVLLVTDLVLRCIVMPNYFQWKVVCRRKEFKFKIGSFVFWLDAASVASVIRCYSWIWDHRKTMTLTLNEFGFPTRTINNEKYNLFTWYDLLSLLDTVLRLGIMFRFVRHLTKETSRCNWYGFFCKANPFYDRLEGHTSISTFYGVSLFEGSEREALNAAATTIQEWWWGLKQRGKVHNTRVMMRKNSILGYSSTTSTTNNHSFVRSSDFIKKKSTQVQYRYSKNAQGEQQKSQIGRTMEELTGERVAQAMLLLMTLTLFFTYWDRSRAEPYAMMVLHTQTQNDEYSNIAINSARNTALRNMFQYTFSNGTIQSFDLDPHFSPNTNPIDPSTLHEMEIFEVTVQDAHNATTNGLMSLRVASVRNAIVKIWLVAFLLLIWFFANVSLSGPVTQLVVLPIERMIQLLRMMMKDPLGYRSSYKFVKFVEDERKLTHHTGWTTHVLKGMETSFLMGTILQISSLLKVGFGAAGVDIIRQGLEESAKATSSLMLNFHGTNVKCIFLFCDIRQFTDTTEVLLEEIFVFTNKVASIIHPICSAYGGSANKNVGDAFLMSWVMGEPKSKKLAENSSRRTIKISTLHELINRRKNVNTHRTDADRALLAVVKILCALYHDNYILDALTENAQNRLLEKFADRPGPLVQLGFGIHVGDAVLGAIGTQRKIDTTYLSENVDFSEYLESSTKAYGVKMLMSQEFYSYLSSGNKQRCRMVDRVCFDYLELDEEGDSERAAAFSITELYTLDLDIDALWKIPKKKDLKIHQGNISATDLSSKKSADGSTETDATSSSTAERKTPVLHIPTGFVTYKESDWKTDDMIEMRRKFVEFPFLKIYKDALQFYYGKDWRKAQTLFFTILGRIDDGPSRYFVKKIETNNGKPPKNFKPFNY